MARKPARIESRNPPVHPDSRMFLYDERDSRTIGQKLTDEGIVPAKGGADTDLPPGVYSSKYRPIGERPLERARRVSVEAGMANASGTTQQVLRADKIADKHTVKRAEDRLQFLRQVQTLIDETDAKIALRKIQEADARWQDDETPIRDPVDNWADEQPEKIARFKFKYKTPKPQSPLLDRYAAILEDMRHFWTAVDLDQQARGYRPSKDRSRHFRDKGTMPNLGMTGITAAMKASMPELFGSVNDLRPAPKSTKSQRQLAKQDPWLDAMFDQIRGRRAAQ